MKKLIAGLLFLSAISVNAQNDKYEAAMKKSFQMLDSAKTTEESQAASASFERIANAEKTQWLPYYYAALALSTPGWTDTKLDKDKNAEKIKLSGQEVKTFIEKFKENGFNNMGIMTDYLQKNNDKSNSDKISATIGEGLKENNPKLSDDEVENKIIDMILESRNNEK